MIQYSEYHYTYLSIRLLLISLLSLLRLPVYPQSLMNSVIPTFNLILTVANSAMEEYQKKQNTRDDDNEVDYDELIERLHSGTFKENDWGYDEEQDVGEDGEENLRDMDLKQLEALSGLEGDCSEIDEHLINQVTVMNEMVYFQETMRVRNEEGV